MKKRAKYVLISAALLVPVASLAASLPSGGDCNCPICPVKGKR